jgi:hypothetical protein
MKQYTELPDNSVEALQKLPVADLKKYDNNHSIAFVCWSFVTTH